VISLYCSYVNWSGRHWKVCRIEHAAVNYGGKLKSEKLKQSDHMSLRSHKFCCQRFHETWSFNQHYGQLYTTSYLICNLRGYFFTF